MKQNIVGFENWIKFVFDHPVTDPAWYWDDDFYWQENYKDWTAATTVNLLTETFMRSGEVLLAYSDAQVNQGLNYLVSSSCSIWMHDVFDESVSWPDRRNCIRSISTLFEQCFAKRCSPHSSHLNERKANPLNSVCYMWWDVFPYVGRPNDPTHAEIDAEFLRVIKQTLYLDSDACCESALHGLGHWQMHYPDETTSIIDEFLASRPRLRRGLKSYALQAQEGDIE